MRTKVFAVPKKYTLCLFLSKSVTNVNVYFFVIQVNGFPTIFIYRDGEKVTEYNGSRSLDDLYQFVLKHSVEPVKDEL